MLQSQQRLAVRTLSPEMAWLTAAIAGALDTARGHAVATSTSTSSSSAGVDGDGAGAPIDMDSRHVDLALGVLGVGKKV